MSVAIAFANASVFAVLIGWKLNVCETFPVTSPLSLIIVVLLPGSYSQSIFPPAPTALPVVLFPFTVITTSLYVVLFALSKLYLCLG